MGEREDGGMAERDEGTPFTLGRRRPSSGG